MNKPFDYNSDNQIFVRNRICQQFPQQMGKNGCDRRTECAKDCMACQLGVNYLSIKEWINSLRGIK